MDFEKTYVEMIEELNLNANNKLLSLYKIIIKNLEKEDCDKYHFKSDCSYFSKYTTYFNVNKEEFNNIGIPCTIHSPSRVLKVSYNNDVSSKFLEVTVTEYKGIYYSPKDKSLNPSGYKTKKKLLIFEDLSVYQERLNGGLYPSTLSSISELTYYGSKFNLTLIESLYEYFSTEHILFKDIYCENKINLIFLPIKVNDIWKFNTKLELIKNYIKKIELPKSMNSFSLQEGYLLAKCKKYVKEDEWQKLYILKGKLNFSRKIKSSAQIKACFSKYYLAVCGNNNDLSENDESYIFDYVDMVWEYSKSKKFNLKLNTLNSIKKAHDILTEDLYIKSTPTIRIKKDSKFKNLNLGEEFELIKTRKRLIQETSMQNHCVWSRGNLINRDSCMVYSVIYNKNRYTLEVGVSKNKFHINEIKGFNNSLAPKELIESIEKKLKAQEVFKPKKGLNKKQ